MSLFAAILRRPFVVVASRCSSAAVAAIPGDRSTTTASTTTTTTTNSVGTMPATQRTEPTASRFWYHTTSIQHQNTSGESGDGHETTTPTPTPTTTRTPWSELLEARIGGDLSIGFDRPSWSEEWKRLGLGADLVVDDDTESGLPNNLFFVQLGFGVDQHGDRSSPGFATKAAIRAVRNAIEFNSIPGVIDHLPGGRHEMIIHVKLGVPLDDDDDDDTTGDGGDTSASPLTPAETIDALEVAKVFPYGKLLPIEIVKGGLDFHSGRIVEELGDEDDVGICCVACVSIGYNNKDSDNGNSSSDDRTAGHTTYNTKDGY